MSSVNPTRHIPAPTICFLLYAVLMKRQLRSMTIGIVKQSSSWIDVIVVYW
jgi:hypothetical protein